MWQTRALAFLIGVGAAIGVVVGYWTYQGTGDQ